MFFHITAALSALRSDSNLQVDDDDEEEDEIEDAHRQRGRTAQPLQVGVVPNARAI